MIEQTKYKKWEIRFALMIPIINVLGWFFGFFFPRGMFNPGNLRAYLILGFVFYVFLRRFATTRLNKNIFTYLLFTFFLVILFSENRTESLYIYSKYFMATALFFVGYTYGKTNGFLKSLLIVYMLTLSLLLVTVLLSNIFSFGYTSYEGVDDLLFFGPAGVNISKNIVSIIILFPLLKHFITSKNKFRFYSLIFLMGMIVLFLAFKRTPMVSLIICFLYYFLYTPRKSKIIKGLVSAGIIIISLSPFFFDKIIQNYEAREDAVRLDDPENLEKQSRYNEIFMVLDKFENGSIRHKLLGSNFFNDRAFYKTERMIHTDYMSVLSGTGLIGLIWFLYLYFSMFRNIRFHFQIRKTDLTRDMYLVGAMLIFNGLILGIAGTIPTIEPRSLIFLFLGAITSFLYTESANYYKNSNSH